jgi:hypothetical protein
MADADKRVEELLDRWMASLELHARYLKLDAAAYARVEPWPRHQRPNAWVIELARKRLLEMRALVTQRAAVKDESFAEALELMSFLTNLLGSEHIDRFIPLATGKRPDTGASGTVEQPRIRPDTGASGTVEQPRIRTSPKPAAHRSGTAAPRTPASPSGARPKVAVAPPKRTSRAETTAGPRPAPQSPAPASLPPLDAAGRQVIADAVRMLEWGREWPALAGLIARMADRPSEPEVWKILRAYRSQILAKARRPAG